MKVAKVKIKEVVFLYLRIGIENQDGFFLTLDNARLLKYRRKKNCNGIQDGRLIEDAHFANKYVEIYNQLQFFISY